MYRLEGKIEYAQTYPELFTSKHQAALAENSLHRAAERLEMEKKISRLLESAMRTASLRALN